MERRTFMNLCLAGSVAPLAMGDSDSGESGWLQEAAGHREAWLKMLGPFPETIPPLESKMESRGLLEPGIEFFHVSFRTEGDDRVTGYLLVPEVALPGPSPVVICPHSTTRGAGKERIVGLAGAAPGDPPDPPETSRAYGRELARWGYVTLCIDLYGDGERVPPGVPPYHTGPFYEKHPKWSVMGKIVWDVMRSVDFLLTLDYVDSKRIACLGHSLGGQSSLFSAAFEPRIAAAVTNGGMLSWVRDTDHWARPPDPSNRPVSSWVYIPRFRPYIEDPALPIPIDFEHLMMLVAPRPLLVMSSEEEFRRHGLADRLEKAGRVYRAQDAGDRMGQFSYPGGHNYPPVAKRHSFNWLDRWLDHKPNLAAIWPGEKI